MVRVLVFGMTENPGGVESFLLNYYRRIDKNVMQWDFLCNSHNPVAYENELTALGGRCFHITARSADRKKYRQELEAVFREHSSEWSAVWVNVSSLANIDYLKIAKKYGIKRRIIHSHNSRNMDSRLRGLLHRWNKLQIGKIATDFWACSEDAARWFYYGETLRRAVIIHNAIDVEHMRFSPEKREAIRTGHGWQNKFVIGNVGRLHFQKNQSFAIDIFAQYHKQAPDSVLVLVGQGEDEQMLKQKVNAAGLADSVYFVGLQSDIQGWLSAFDLFLFPSRYEGLSVAALEAQANGVAILASKGVIPEQVKMNNNFIFSSLDAGTGEWCSYIDTLRYSQRPNNEDILSSFNEKGFNILTEADALQKRLL